MVSSPILTLGRPVLSLHTERHSLVGPLGMEKNTHTLSVEKTDMSKRWNMLNNGTMVFPYQNTCNVDVCWSFGKQYTPNVPSRKGTVLRLAPCDFPTGRSHRVGLPGCGMALHRFMTQPIGLSASSFVVPCESPVMGGKEEQPSWKLMELMRRYYPTSSEH